MYSLVMCGPMIYRNALTDHVRLARADVRVVGQSNHAADAAALIAHSLPDAAIIVSPAIAAAAEFEVKRIRRVDLDVRLVWWALTAEAADIAERLRPLDVEVVSWEATADQIVGAVGPVRLTAKQQQRPRLTAQELLVLQLAADGCSNTEIAGRLAITQSTVKNHLRHIGAKLHTNSRAEAVWQAVQWGYLLPTSKSA